MQLSQFLKTYSILTKFGYTYSLLYNGIVQLTVAYGVDPLCVKDVNGQLNRRIFLVTFLS